MSAPIVAEFAPIDTRKIQILGNGVTREWAFDGKVVIVALKSFARPTIDAAVKAIMDAKLHWTADRMHFIIDMSIPGMLILPPYLQARTKELTAFRPELISNIAVVVPKTFFAQLAARFANAVKPENTTVRIFYSRAEALDWFEKLIGSHDE
jgi:hypothetical protein